MDEEFQTDYSKLVMGKIRFFVLRCEIFAVRTKISSDVGYTRTTNSRLKENGHREDKVNTSRPYERMYRLH